MPRIGDVLDSRYRITGVLGSGGMGCVYLAQHVSIQRPVALKLLHPEIGEVDEVIKRFEREAFAIGQVDHPNCVKVADFGRLPDGTLYMVLELLDGLLLSDLLDRQRRVAWRRTLHVGRHILSALAYAHDAGIIHRDVKPENVILVEQDDDVDFAKILDFGIASLRDATPETDDDATPLTNDAKLTQLGVTIGTPTYISPEQAYGIAIDGRTDIYALSVMMYEMIVGKPPFDAHEVGTLLRMHISAEVPRFSEVAPDVEVPESVERLIRHGLAKKAGDRIGSANEYIERIDEILSDKSQSESGPRRMPSVAIGDVRSSLKKRVAGVMPKTKKSRGVLALASLVVLLIAVLAFTIGDEDSEVGQTGDEPYAQLRVGHAEARAERNILALVSYEKAVTLDSKLANNKHMRANVERMLDRRSPPPIADAAIDFLGTLVSTTGDEAAANQLIELASWSKLPRRRHKAMKVAGEVGLGDRVDRVGSYLLDLEQGETCLLRKAAVADLRALGDERAIPGLRKARHRTKDSIARRKVNINACLRGSANEAIRHLQGR